MQSADFMSTVKSMEIVFRKFHGETVNIQPHPIAKLSQQIRLLHPTFTKDIVDLFSKTRLFIRIKTLNTRYKNKQEDARKFVKHVNKFRA